MYAASSSTLQSEHFILPTPTFIHPRSAHTFGEMDPGFPNQVRMEKVLNR